VIEESIDEVRWGGMYDSGRTENGLGTRGNIGSLCIMLSLFDALGCL
jgi:hypothetical protein